MTDDQFVRSATRWTFGECYAQSTDPQVLTLSALIRSAVAR